MCWKNVFWWHICFGPHLQHFLTSTLPSHKSSPCRGEPHNLGPSLWNPRFVALDLAKSARVHMHKDTNFCPSSQWWGSGFGGAPSYLQDVCCSWHLSWLRGAMNFMQTPPKHSVPRARGRPSRRHHKSIHAKINHFHWTPSLRRGGGGGGGNGRRELDDEEGTQREGRRFTERSVNIQENTRGLTQAPFLPH